MTIEQKLQSFIARQAELVSLDQKIGVKVKEIEAKANAECEAIGQKAMAEADAIRAPLLKKVEEYRALVKAEFGIADGETMNVVQLLNAVYNMGKKSSGLILP